ncbi:diguanylate cyclase [Nitrospira sp. M1]
MFKRWSGDDKKSTGAKLEYHQSRDPASAHEHDHATPASEALAKILRALGRQSFDLDHVVAEDIEKNFERWAMHVLVGASTVEDEEPLTDGRRDWGGLNRFVNTHRQQEKKYVSESLSDLRDVLLTFTQTIGQTVIDDQETDRQLAMHLGGLQAASETHSAEEMKNALLLAVQGISQVIVERKQRQQAHVEILGSKLQKMQTELGQARAQMTLDPLTKLYNRAALDTQLERVVGLSLLAGSEASVLMIDVDHFKQVNDTFGHRAGDAVLQQFADRLVSTFLRKSDFLARYGGEEMAVLLQSDGLDISSKVAERFLEAVRNKPFEHEGTNIPITVSIGLAELMPGESVASWIERADRALYQAKETGRDRLCVAPRTLAV